MGRFWHMSKRYGFLAGGAVLALALTAACTNNGSGNTSSNGGSNNSANGGAAINLSPVSEIQAALTKAANDKTVKVHGTISSPQGTGTLDAQEQFGNNIAMLLPNCSWASSVPVPCGLLMVPCTLTVLSFAALVSAAWISETGDRLIAAPPFALLLLPPFELVLPLPLFVHAAVSARARTAPPARNPYRLDMCQNLPMGSGHFPRHPIGLKATRLRRWAY